MSEISLGIFSDVLGLFGVPANTASAIFKSVLESRRKEALEILFMEIRQGNFEKVDQNETVSIIARFLRDAEEGVARNNIKLLARTIRGMADEKQLAAPSFNRFAGVLASLSEEEIKLLGYMQRNGFAEYLRYEKQINQDLKPMHAPAVFQALVRTGLISFVQGVETEYQPEHGDDYGVHDASASSEFWTNYETTELFNEVMAYTRFFDL